MLNFDVDCGQEIVLTFNAGGKCRFRLFKTAAPAEPIAKSPDNQGRWTKKFPAGFIDGSAGYILEATAADANDGDVPVRVKVSTNETNIAPQEDDADGNQYGWLLGSVPSGAFREFFFDLYCKA